MLDTVRARLTFWYTAVLALVLSLFALGAYVYLARTEHRRVSDAIIEANRAFVAELRLEREAAGSDSLAAAAAVGEFRFRDLLFAVYRRDGSLLERTPALTVGDLAASSLAHALGTVVRAGPRREPFAVSIPGDEGGYRAVMTLVPMHEGAYWAAVVRSMHVETEALEEARRAVLVALPLALLVAGLGGYLLARRSLAPVVAMAERAERIGATSLAERLPSGNPRDELGRLAGSFNALLARLEGAFAEQRRFMADASHELRTPVAVVQTEAAVALERPDRAADEYRESLGVVLDAGRRLGRLVDDLFLLARADSGETPLQPVDLYLDELVEDTVRAVRSLAETRGVGLTAEIAPDAPFRGDEELLRRLLLNVLDNAVKYTEAGGTVALALVREYDVYAITIADTGRGIPSGEEGRIFDRFYRADQARSPASQTRTSGAGLGLAIAAWVARAHGGTIRLVSSGPAGSRFRVELPASRL